MPTPTDAKIARGIKYYSATPDLTRTNHFLLTNLKRDDRVKAAWSIDGHIRFCLVANDKVKYQVRDVYSSVDDIITSCATACLKSEENLTSFVKKRDSNNVLPTDVSSEDREDRDDSRSTGRTGSRSPGGRSPVQAEMRGGQRLPPPVGSRRPGFRAVVENNKKK